MAVLTDIRNKISGNKTQDQTEGQTQAETPSDRQSGGFKSFLTNGFKSIRRISFHKPQRTTSNPNAGGQTQIATSTGNTAATSAAENVSSRTKPLINVEPKPLKYRPPGNRRELNDQTQETLRKIGDHLGEHAKKTGELVKSVQTIADGLDMLEDHGDNQHKIIEVLNAQLAVGREHDQRLRHHIERTEASHQQNGALLEALRAHLQSTDESAERVGNAFDSLDGSIAALGESTTQSMHLLGRIARAIETRDEQLVTALNRTQKWTVSALVACGGTAIVAVIIALAAA